MLEFCLFVDKNNGQSIPFCVAACYILLLLLQSCSAVSVLSTDSIDFSVKLFVCTDQYKRDPTEGYLALCLFLIFSSTLSFFPF